MAKLSKRSRHPEAPAPAAEPAPRVAPRRKAADQRLLERLTRGLSVADIPIRRAGAATVDESDARGGRWEANHKLLKEFLAKVSGAGIATREGLRAKRSRPEMAPQRLEKTETALGNGMVSEPSKPQDLVHGRAADRALRLRAARMTKLKVTLTAGVAAVPVRS